MNHQGHIILGILSLILASGQMSCKSDSLPGKRIVSTLAPKELGQRPSLPRMVDNRTSANDDTKFESMIQVNGKAALALVTRTTVGRVGKAAELNLNTELSCTIAANTVVSVVGREGSTQAGEGLYLVQLEKPCKIGNFLLSELYIEEKDVKLVDNTAQLPASAQQQLGTVNGVEYEPGGYQTPTQTGQGTGKGDDKTGGKEPHPVVTVTVTVTPTPAPTVTVTHTPGSSPAPSPTVTASQTPGSSPAPEPVPTVTVTVTPPDRPTSSPTPSSTPSGEPSQPEGCKALSQIRLDQPNAQVQQAAAQRPGYVGECSNLIGAGAKLSSSCMWPGADWRAGAPNLALKLIGKADQFKVSITKTVINGTLAQCQGQNVQQNPFGGILWQGNFAGLGGRYNCDVMESVVVKAADVAVPDQKDTYLLPMPRLIKKPNDWMGVAIKFTVEAQNAAGERINQCSHDMRLVSPIVLDFTGERFLKSVSIQDSKVAFDLAANGAKVKTGWVDGNRGLLALDRNHDGVISSGAELFGEGTRLENGAGYAENGYEALKQFDTRGKGFLDKSDDVYSRLVVWFDLNQDGVSQQEELKSLAALGVTRIDTSYREADQYLLGTETLGENIVRWQSTFYDQNSCKLGCSSYDIYFSTASQAISAVQ
jgi:hypothetical protein